MKLKKNDEIGNWENDITFSQSPGFLLDASVKFDNNDKETEKCETKEDSNVVEIQGEEEENPTSYTFVRVDKYQKNTS